MQSIIFLILLINIIGTILGSLLCCCIKKNKTTFAIGLSFSAGIMIYTSLADLLKKSETVFLKIYTQTLTNWLIILLFCISIFLTLIIDIFLEKINYKIINTNIKITKNEIKKLELIKIIIFSIISITLHNIPEGLYVFIVSNNELKTFYLVILPMILHNILESIVIAFPLYYLTNNKIIVAYFSFICGMFEIFGLLFITILSHSIINYYIFCFLIIFSSAMMLYVSFNKILPIAKEYGNDKIIFIGILTGIIFMMISISLIPNMSKIFLYLYQ